MISDPKTSLGGPGCEFPQTSWSQVLLTATSADEPTVRAAIESFARAYWKPIYAFIRARWMKSNEDAKDLTQEFFAWLLESRFTSRADPERGRFRSFLKTALDHFLLHDQEKRT